MSANDIDELDPAVARYVDAFDRAERPTAAAADRSWAAIAAATAEPVVIPVRAWRRPWVIATMTLAAAAAVALLASNLVGRTELAQAPRPTEAVDRAAAPEPREAIVRAPAAELPSTTVAPPAPAPTPDAVVPAPVDDPRDRPTRRERPAAVAEPTVDNALAEETRLWRLAQSELASGDTAAALAAIARWTERFPTAQFAAERSLLHARALCAAGRQTEARTVRDAFVARHPAAPLAARMRKVCTTEKDVP